MPAAAYDFEDMDPFFRDLGELQAKLLSLEYLLRTFLFRHAGLPFMQDFDSISVGDVIDANPFTNYDQLGALIDKYNKAVQPKDASLMIHPDIVDIRHALAHGRLYRKSKESQPRLLKFSDVDKATGKVEATMVQTLDPAKLQAWRIYLSMMERRVFDALP
jgi:hypothetical protein